MDSSIEVKHSKNISNFVNKDDKSKINDAKNISIRSEISDKIHKYKTKSIKHIKINSMRLPKKINKFAEKNLNQCHINKKLKLFYTNRGMIKSDSASSYATTFYSNTQKECKIKTVTFSTVEVIRIKSYKKYNAMNNVSKLLIQKNLYEKRKEQEGSSLCNIF